MDEATTARPHPTAATMTTSRALTVKTNLPTATTPTATMRPKSDLNAEAGFHIEKKSLNAMTIMRTALTDVMVMRTASRVEVNLDMMSARRAVMENAVRVDHMDRMRTPANELRKIVELCVYGIGIDIEGNMC
jgi:hypothetical protein